MDFTVFYIFMKRRVPALFIDIRTFLALNHGPSRAAADSQMRERFLDFCSGSLPQSKLIGISAMGTRFAVYEYTPQDRHLVPSCIMPHPDIVTDTAPKERWNYDIMEAAKPPGRPNSGQSWQKSRQCYWQSTGNVNIIRFLFFYSRPFTDLHIIERPLRPFPAARALALITLMTCPVPRYLAEWASLLSNAKRPCHEMHLYQSCDLGSRFGIQPSSYSSVEVNDIGISLNTAYYCKASSLRPVR